MNGGTETLLENELVRSGFGKNFMKIEYGDVVCAGAGLLILLVRHAL